MTDMTATMTRPTLPKIAPLPAARMKTVWENFQKFVGPELTETLLGFSVGGRMRSGANCEVNFEKNPRGGTKNFAIVSWFVDLCGDTWRDFVKTRDRNRGRDTQGMTRGRTGGSSATKPNTAPKANKPKGSASMALGIINTPAPPGGRG